MIPTSFHSGQEVIEKIEQHGYEAYFVGGCVRDFILGRKIGDIDIATSATPNQIQHIFSETIPVGIEHGTVIVRYKKQSFEVTTFRTDGTYSDQRHPDFIQFVSNIDEDLKRRDFTINALAMGSDGRILDLFQGQQDIKERIIRTVGDGMERFSEDPLRIIRGLRFSSQLGFQIDSDTLRAMEQTKAQLENISVERIATEVEKLFAGEHVSIGLNHLIELEIYNHLPVMNKSPEIMRKLPNINSPIHSLAELFTLLHYFSKIPIQTWVSEWKCSKKTKINAVKIGESIKYFESNGLDAWLVYDLDQELFGGFVRLIKILYPEQQLTVEQLENMSGELPIQSKRELKLNGHDVSNLFPERSKGPWINTALNLLEKAVVFKEVNNSKNELKEWLKWNLPEIN
ncbi:CCA tRNA nucleotidyltransferase [Ornithinibacillus halophilus]|uniref:CCA-adding enzyme n=1 Tax=Ornithinibacillus halophilus TaxID=930117 RepID=A0A1M5CNM2_9BACI|nr:CCA tRNA nucleotidyltransferase [Ornithinibacillus halophilus]SHF56217.1 tRNA nucleotidyltransferase (CCA-adding enzyme) [Ornithinibacillus halophilus]